MRNRILYVTRSTVPYVKELMPLAGSVAGCILMQQLDFWFERFPAGFYKFQDATEHALYKRGDSWCEELGFSVDEFRTAFDKIGVRHKSKSQYEQAGDKFQGKFYCSYFDRRTQLTYYFRNHALLDHALDQLIAQVPASPSPGSHGPQQPPTPANSRREPPRPSVEASPFTVNGESPFTVNGQSPFTGNGQSQDPVNRQSPSTVNRETPLTYLDNLHLQETGKAHFQFTETTFSETTQRPQQQPPHAARDASERGPPARGGCGGQTGLHEEPGFGTLVLPAKALPVERGELLKLLRDCPPENRQEVLDEIEGAARRNALRAGIVPFGRYLVSAIENGRFAPNLGVQVRAERLAAAEAEARKVAAARATAAEPPAMTDADATCLPVGLRQQLLALRMRAAERTLSSAQGSSCAEGPMAHTAACAHAGPPNHAGPSSARIRSAPETGTAARPGASSHQLVDPCGDLSAGEASRTCSGGPP